MTAGSGDTVSNTAPEGDGGTWFNDVADHLGPAYLRYSFTKGTEQEVTFLLQSLDLAGDRVLDVGCGPGRHVAALAERGVQAVGIDLSEAFCRLVPRTAGDRGGSGPSTPTASNRAPGGGLGAVHLRAAPTWHMPGVAVGDVRRLPIADDSFDAVISLCQGGFGLLGGPGAPIDADRSAMREMARCVVPGGALVLSAFSAYFQVRHQADLDDADFDVAAGVMHERTQIKDGEGHEVPADLWTTGFTPRELRLLADSVGLEVEAVYSVEPGDYAPRPPELDCAEFLLIARRPT